VDGHTTDLGYVSLTNQRFLLFAVTSANVVSVNFDLSAET